jgi:succinoglycan biosynthesis protein ExoH
MTYDQQVSNRIAMLRFLMIAGVVLLHTPKAVPMELVGTGVFDFIKAFFQNVVFRTTVPVLTCISGYFLFSAKLDLAPLKLWKKKFKTLVIPFFVFNVSLFVLAYIAQRTTGLVFSYNLVHADASVWSNALLGLHGLPINYPLNFLRDLVMLVLIAPALGMLLRQAPIVGLAVVWLVFMFNLDGALVLRNNMAVMFYVGGMLGVAKSNLLMLDKYAPVALITFVVLCVTILMFRVSNTTYLGYVAPFLLWSMAALVVNTAAGKWMSKMSKYSFFIFIAHAPVLYVTWFVYQKVAAYVPYPVYWVMAPTLTIGVLVIVYQYAMKIAPTFFATIIGAKQRPAQHAVLVKTA